MNKLGYYKHKQTFTEEEIARMFAEDIGDVSEYTVKQEEQNKIFAKLSEVDGFRDWLRATSAKDIQRYFAAEDDNVRQVVKGATARTAYIRSLLSKTNEVSVKKSTKVEGLRYSK